MKARYLNNNYSSIASTLAGAGIGALAGAGVGGLVHAMTKEEAFEEYKKICKNTNQEPASREEFYKSDLCKKMVVGGIAGAGIGGLGGFIHSSIKDEEKNKVRSRIEAEKMLEERKNRLAAPQSDKLSPTNGPSSPSGEGSGPNGSGSPGGLPGGRSPNPTNGPNNNNNNNTTTGNRIWTQGPSNTSYDEDGNPTGFVSQHTSPDNSKKEGKVFRNEGGKDPLGESGDSGSNNTTSNNTSNSGSSLEAVPNSEGNVYSSKGGLEPTKDSDSTKDTQQQSNKPDDIVLKVAKEAVNHDKIVEHVGNTKKDSMTDNLYGLYKNDRTMTDEEKVEYYKYTAVEAYINKLSEENNLTPEQYKQVWEIVNEDGYLSKYRDIKGKKDFQHKFDKIKNSISQQTEKMLERYGASLDDYVRARIQGLSDDLIQKAVKNNISVDELIIRHQQDDGKKIPEWLDEVIGLGVGTATGLIKNSDSKGSGGIDVEPQQANHGQQTKSQTPPQEEVLTTNKSTRRTSTQVVEDNLKSASKNSKIQQNDLYDAIGGRKYISVPQTKQLAKSLGISVTPNKYSPKITTSKLNVNPQIRTRKSTSAITFKPSSLSRFFSYNLFEVPNSMGINEFFSKSFIVEDEFGDKAEVKEKKARDIAIKIGLAGAGGLGGFVGEDYIPGIGDLSVGPIDVGGTVLGTVGLNSGILAADKIVDKLYTKEAIKKLEDIKLSKGEYKRLLVRNGINEG